MDQAGVALYHRVMRRENFEKAAKDLVSLVYAAEKKAVSYTHLDVYKRQGLLRCGDC